MFYTTLAQCNSKITKGMPAIWPQHPLQMNLGNRDARDSESGIVSYGMSLSRAGNCKDDSQGVRAMPWLDDILR